MILILKRWQKYSNSCHFQGYAWYLNRNIPGYSLFRKGFTCFYSVVLLFFFFPLHLGWVSWWPLSDMHHRNTAIANAWAILERVEISLKKSKMDNIKNNILGWYCTYTTSAAYCHDFGALLGTYHEQNFSKWLVSKVYTQSCLAKSHLSIQDLLPHC